MSEKGVAAIEKLNFSVEIFLLSINFLTAMGFFFLTIWLQ